MEFKHTSVLLEETIQNLRVKPDGIYIDGTLGGGGHSYQIASKLTGKGRLVGIDQDGEAILAAAERLEPFGKKSRSSEIITVMPEMYCKVSVLRRLTVLYWIWGFPLTSWIMEKEDFPTNMMRIWTCAWIRGSR